MTFKQEHLVAMRRRAESFADTINAMQRAQEHYLIALMQAREAGATSEEVQLQVELVGREREDRRAALDAFAQNMGRVAG